MTATSSPPADVRRQKKQDRQARRKRVRARIRHVALTKAPLWLSGGRIVRSRSVCDIRAAERHIFLPNLPEALDGLRVTHISDLHIGSVTRPDCLPALLDRCHRLEGDLIAVTGDLVDLSHDVLGVVLEAMSRLSAPLGTFFVPGNHDYLDDAPGFVRRAREAGLNLLINDAAWLKARDCNLLLAGIDYAHRPDELSRLVRGTFRDARSNGHPSPDLRLLLAHHPDAFDAASKIGVQLTLSGHTHGGQLALAGRRGKKGSIGLGSMAFRYPHGLYRRGDCHLHVTSGVGSWFPLRVNCPAEIVSLTLHHGLDPTDQTSHP